MRASRTYSNKFSPRPAGRKRACSSRARREDVKIPTDRKPNEKKTPRTISRHAHEAASVAPRALLRVCIRQPTGKYRTSQIRARSTPKSRAHLQSISKCLFNRVSIVGVCTCVRACAHAIRLYLYCLTRNSGGHEITSVHAFGVLNVRQSASSPEKELSENQSKISTKAITRKPIHFRPHARCHPLACQNRNPQTFRLRIPRVVFGTDN